MNNKFFQTNLPYAIACNENDEWMVFNRMYLPLGYNKNSFQRAGHPRTSFDEFPIHSHYKFLTHHFLLQLADGEEYIKKDKDGKIVTVYLYIDKTNPARLKNDEELWTRYFDKLRMLSDVPGTLIYNADNELVQLLLKNGFIETTNPTDQAKGKRSFKKSKTSRHKFYFNYQSMEIIKNNQVIDHFMSLNYNELKLMLLLFNLKPAEFNAFSEDPYITIKEAAKRLNAIKNEYNDLIELNIKLERQRKLKKIIDIYEGSFV
jgi:hypothetical protein